MTLAIVNGGTMQGTLDVFVVTPDMINAASTHLFIAANTWDKAIVEIGDSLRLDMLKYIQLGSTPIEVILHDDLSADDIQRLAHLFPDKAGAIRRAYLMHKPMSEVVPVCMV